MDYKIGDEVKLKIRGYDKFWKKNYIINGVGESDGEKIYSLISVTTYGPYGEWWCGNQFMPPVAYATEKQIKLARKKQMPKILDELKIYKVNKD